MSNLLMRFFFIYTLYTLLLGTNILHELNNLAHKKYIAGKRASQCRVFLHKPYPVNSLKTWHQYFIRNWVVARLINHHFYFLTSYVVYTKTSTCKALAIMFCLWHNPLSTLHFYIRAKLHSWCTFLYYQNLEHPE